MVSPLHGLPIKGFTAHEKDSVPRWTGFTLIYVEKLLSRSIQGRVPARRILRAGSKIFGTAKISAFLNEDSE